jgi:DNA polymerase type B, organellar and viral
VNLPPRFKTLPSDLRPIFRPVGPTKPIRDNFRIIGWDSETDKNGNTYLITHTARKESVLLAPKGQTLKPVEMLEFLLQHGRHNNGRPVINLWWNIAFDIDSILKGAGVSRADWRKGRMGVGEFSVRWLKGKMFSIRKGHVVAVFYDANNFFKMSLDKAAATYLGAGKGKVGAMDIAAGREKYSDAELVSRCKTDARLTRDLGEFLVRYVDRLIGFIPKKWFGGARLAEEVLRAEVPESILHPFRPEDRSILDYAYRSYYGGRFDLFVKGRITEAFEMDYSSGYPNEIRDLVALNTGSWEYVDTPTNSAIYGFYRIACAFDGLLPYRVFSVFYPQTANWREAYVCRSELEEMWRRGTPLAVIDGWEFHADKKVYPFRTIIDRLFKVKCEARASGDEFRERLAKLVMNSIYGKFAQTKGGCGRLFNPVFAAEITARVRIRILNDATKYFSEVYEIKTDSVVGRLRPEWAFLWKLSDEQIAVVMPETLGAFVPKKMAKQVPVRINLQIGITLNGVKELIHNRGFAIKNKKIVIGDEEDHITIPVTRPLHMGEALARHRVSEVNVFHEAKKQIRVGEGAFRKRLFPEGLKVRDLERRVFAGEPIDDAYLEGLDPQTDEQIAELQWGINGSPLPRPKFEQFWASAETNSYPHSAQSPSQSALAVSQAAAELPNPLPDEKVPSSQTQGAAKGVGYGSMYGEGSRLTRLNLPCSLRSSPWLEGRNIRNSEGRWVSKSLSNSFLRGSCGPHRDSPIAQTVGPSRTNIPSQRPTQLDLEDVQLPSPSPRRAAVPANSLSRLSSPHLAMPRIAPALVRA